MREQISLETLRLGGYEDPCHDSLQGLDDDGAALNNDTSHLITNKPYLTPGAQLNLNNFGWSVWDRLRRFPSLKACKDGLWSPTGWRQGTSVATVIVFVILIINIIITAIWDCNSIKRAGISIHLAINIASTLLLGASNYCMQTISAPSRADVDRAHAKGSWVDIGVPSLRNLRWIAKRRLLVWLLLGLTSIPLHLVYNSTFFVSTHSNLYTIWFADESFASGAGFNGSAFRQGHEYVDPWSAQKNLEVGGIYQNLTNDECITSYAKTVLGDRGNLVLVLETPVNCTGFEQSPSFMSGIRDKGCGDTYETSLYAMARYNLTFEPSTNLKNWFYWICDEYDIWGGDWVSCSEGGWKSRLEPAPWKPGGQRVKYCLSEKVNSQCQLKVALILLYVVIAFNTVKLVLIVTIAATSLINHNPLVTLGDAIDSFIKYPDPATNGLCLVPIEVLKCPDDYSRSALNPRPHKVKRRWWAGAIGQDRWILMFSMFALALGTVMFFLTWASVQLERRYSRGKLSSLWGMGFGAITPYSIIQGWGVPTDGNMAVIVTIFIVNVPQLLLSMIYVVFNAAVTAMTAAAEWARYSEQPPAPLRVSFPEEGQRSTFFLQLPYRYSVPMMALSALIHWLISQSLFIIQLIERQLWTYADSNAPLEDGSYGALTTAAFSPMASILTCAAFVVAFFAIALLGVLPLKGTIPRVGSCSRGISAACHAPEGTSTLAGMKWGAIYHGNAERGDAVGHCSFSNSNVDLPCEGRLYA